MALSQFKTPNNAFNILRDATIENCKTICKHLEHDVALWEQKYHRIVSDVEKRTENAGYLAPEEWQRRVYNESVRRLKQVEPIV